MQSKYSAFCFKSRIVYIGWIIEKNEWPTVSYHENSAIDYLKPEIKVVFVTIGITQKNVIKKIKKWLNKRR